MEGAKIKCCLAVVENSFADFSSSNAMGLQTTYVHTMKESHEISLRATGRVANQSGRDS